MPVYLIDKIQQKNGGDFALVDAEDIECKDGKRLQDKLDELEESVGSGSGGGAEETTDFVAEFENALAGSATAESEEQ